MARRDCRSPRDCGRARAEATAASIIAQGRDVAARAIEAMEEEMPMNRYIFPLPPAECAFEGCDCAEGLAGADESLTRILETLCCQNQLLVDILGAINAMTAALLSTHCQR